MPAIENLIFSGVGVKGIGYGAVLTVLESLGALEHVRGFAGTSAGAMVACLMAVGYSGAELRHMMLYEHSPEELVGELSPLRLFLDTSTFGLSSGERVLELLRQKIRAKVGRAAESVTFAWLRSELGHDLRVFVTNLNLGCGQELSAETEPDMEVALAVRASMSLPVIFEPVVYRGDYLVDGGMVNNFPMHVFPAHNSLGFSFVRKLAGADGARAPSREQISSRLEFFTQLMVCTMRDSRNRVQPGMAICEIEAGDATSRSFELTLEERFHLDWLGFKSVFTWLASLKRNP
jgi:predicted acylesterase/phospholipase RssA